MKKAVCIVGQLCVFFVCFGQSSPKEINILRYNDDFRPVKNDSVKNGFYRLKYIKISGRSNVSFGGEVREQFQYFRNLNFGDIPPSATKASVGQLWHRMMAHSNIEFGKRWRLFLQLNSTFRFFNPDPLTPEIDENQLSLHQAFVDYEFNKQWMLRVGRQEIGYGNNRLLTFREGPNTRLAFHAAIVKYKTAKRKIDILAVSPVISKQGVFDDASFKEFVGGIYGTEFIIPQLSLDYYFLYFTSGARKYNFVQGTERRLSAGFRLVSKNRVFNYEAEVTYQAGRFNALHIAAYAISGDLNYTINAKLNLMAGVAANYISGDKNSSDGRLNTYNLIYSKPSYGLAAPIGSSNIINFNPYMRIAPLRRLLIYGAVYFMWRQSARDGTYSPGMAQLRPLPSALPNSTSKPIGTQYAIETNYELDKHFSFAVDAAYFKAGRYVKETGKGLNISYLSLKGTFKF